MVIDNTVILAIVSNASGINGKLISTKYKIIKIATVNVKIKNILLYCFNL